MAGDVGVREEVVVLDTMRAGAQARTALEDTDVHVLHDYGSVLVVEGGPETDRALALVLAADAVVMSDQQAAQPDKKPGEDGDLSTTAALGLAAVRRRSSPDYLEAKAHRKRDGQPWDVEDAAVPGCAFVVQPAEDESDSGAKARSSAGSSLPTSQRLSGSVAVGLVMVEGPTEALQFSTAERTTVTAETQNGLTWLGARHPSRPVLWRWDIHVVRLDVQIDDPATDAESRFRDPALAALGFGPGATGARAYAQALRTRLGTDWAFVAFFTKYPVQHFAYAFLGGPHMVMHYENDGWGPDNIDRVFAHETGHIFNAPDEYAASRCDCGGSWGYYGKPNANCENCPGGVDCLMRANSWAMCPHTPWHLGFPMCPPRSGTQFTGSVSGRATRRWFTHSWPADCHVEWTVVPVAPTSGAAQLTWDVQAERASTGYVTYWITITNLTSSSVSFQARYDVLGHT